MRSNTNIVLKIFTKSQVERPCLNIHLQYCKLYLLDVHQQRGELLEVCLGVIVIDPVHDAAEVPVHLLQLLGDLHDGFQLFFAPRTLFDLGQIILEDNVKIEEIYKHF